MANAVQDAQTKRQFDYERGKLLASLPDQERQLLLKMRDSLNDVVKLLVGCQNVAQLAQAFSFLESLQHGEVWVVQEPPTMPEGYVSTKDLLTA